MLERKSDRREFLSLTAKLGLIPLFASAQSDAQAELQRKPETDLAFPGRQWDVIDPEEFRWKTEPLKTALDYGMEQQSSGIVVVQNGRIIAERHAADLKINGAGKLRYQKLREGTNSDGHAIEDVASVQKSIVSILFGIARHKKLVRLNDAASRHLGTGWSKADAAEEKKITLRHLLTMTSGLNNALKFRAAAGSKWQYNTSAYSRTLTAICRAARSEPNPLTKKWLTEPLQMTDSSWVPRREVSSASNAFGFATTARDLARIGVLMLAQGKWNGAAVAPDKKYLQMSIQPSQKLNPAYGFLWWLNGANSAIRSGRRVRGPLVPNAPDDLFAALGALGRKLYVVPSRNLVVTRLGADPGRGFGGEFWKRLMLAAPV